jgi:hypothetical protein
MIFNRDGYRTSKYIRRLRASKKKGKVVAIRQFDAVLPDQSPNDMGAAILSFEREPEDKGQYLQQWPQTTGTDQCLLTEKV